MNWSAVWTVFFSVKIQQKALGKLEIYIYIFFFFETQFTLNENLMSLLPSFLSVLTHIHTLSDSIVRIHSRTLILNHKMEATSENNAKIILLQAFINILLQINVSCRVFLMYRYEKNEYNGHISCWTLSTFVICSPLSTLKCKC